jgi:hypothetical protein
VRTASSIILMIATLAASADHFEDHTAEPIAQSADGDAVKAMEPTAVSELVKSPHPLDGAPASTFVIVKTDEGNWAKLLLRAAERRRKNSDRPDTIVLVERATTYSTGGRKGSVADVRDLFLFDGFGLDLDSGKIVPIGAGDDLLLAATDRGLTIRSSEGVKAFVVQKPLVPSSSSSRSRTFGQGAVTPEDFSGSYDLESDGRWSGQLTLKVGADGVVGGTYVSEQTGREYDVSGKVGSPANRITFSMELPMTTQRFEGYLWSRDRTKIAGVTHMQDRPFGFVATRKAE